MDDRKDERRNYIIAAWYFGRKDLFEELNSSLVMENQGTIIYHRFFAWGMISKERCPDVLVRLLGKPPGP